MNDSEECMKYLLCGDFHGFGIPALERVLCEIKPDVVCCTGDFDRVETILQYKEIEQRLRTEGVRVFNVPGNHDHAHRNGLDLISKNIDALGRTSEQLRKELEENPIAGSYIDQLLTQYEHRFYIDADKYADSFSVILIHGGLHAEALSAAAGRFPSETRRLWYRFASKYDHLINFCAMEEEGVNIMLRGHDHEPAFAQRTETGTFVFPSVEGNSFPLHRGKFYTITHGAMKEGFHVVIDTAEEVPVVSFCKLDS